jgi:hypothetical protein
MSGIVIRQLNTVYWWVPKNACTTMKVHYAKILGLKFQNPHRAKFEITKKIIPEMFNYAFVRHPFQRLYSCWANKIAPGHPIGADFVNDIDINVFHELMDKVYSEMPFEDFALLVMDKKTKGDLHWLPQSKQIPKGVIYYKMEEFPIGAFFKTSNKDHTGGRWQDVFTSRVLEKAIKYYSEDLKRYNYTY